MGFLCGSAGKESACNADSFNSWVGEICWRGDRLPIPVFLGLLGGSAGEESVCNMGDLGSIPVLGRFPGEGKATHFSILAWRISMGSQRVGHE